MAGDSALSNFMKITADLWCNDYGTEAETLDVSASVIEHDWRVAKAWLGLYRNLLQ